MLRVKSDCRPELLNQSSQVQACHVAATKKERSLKHKQEFGIYILQRMMSFFTHSKKKYTAFGLAKYTMSQFPKSYPQKVNVQNPIHTCSCSRGGKELDPCILSLCFLFVSNPAGDHHLGCIENLVNGMFLTVQRPSGKLAWPEIIQHASNTINVVPIETDDLPLLAMFVYRWALYFLTSQEGISPKLEISFQDVFVGSGISNIL